METDFRLQLRFWGVRGSMPTPQQENLRYGGNTPCLEIRLPGDRVWIFDAGTGLRNLASSLVRPSGSGLWPLHLFLTHFHWDHIQGLPFFVPLYDPAVEVSFYSMLKPELLRQTLGRQMCAPYFPVQLDATSSHKSYLEASSPLVFDDLVVTPFPLNHPQKAIGYRIERGGAVVVYASDLEHGDARLDAVVRQFSRNADILIYDAHYTPEEYPDHVGWGHSTWLEGTRLAIACGARQLILFHHHPAHDDLKLAEIERSARDRFPQTQLAREGLCLTL